MRKLAPIAHHNDRTLNVFSHRILKIGTPPSATRTLKMVTLALVSFMGKPLLRIASKSADLRHSSQKSLYWWRTNRSPSVRGKEAIDREVALLVSSMDQLCNPFAALFQDTSPLSKCSWNESNSFLNDPFFLTESETACQVAVYELVDWVRLIGPALHLSELHRLIAAMEGFHKLTLRELFQYLDPQSVSLWDGAYLLEVSSCGSYVCFFFCPSSLIIEADFCSRHPSRSYFIGLAHPRTAIAAVPNV